MRRPIRIRITRDVLMFCLGAYGFIAQVNDKTPSELIILASLGLLGAPVALHVDDRRQDKGKRS